MFQLKSEKDGNPICNMEYRYFAFLVILHM